MAYPSGSGNEKKKGVLGLVMNQFTGSGIISCPDSLYGGLDAVLMFFFYRKRHKLSFHRAQCRDPTRHSSTATSPRKTHGQAKCARE